MNDNQKNDNHNEEPNIKRKTPIYLVLMVLMLTIGMPSVMALSLKEQMLSNEDYSVRMRFDSVNQNNIVYLMSDRSEKNVLKANNTVVVSVDDGMVSVGDEYLQELNLYGYVGPITLMEDMSTYNDGEAYYSNKFRVTITDNTPVEFVHNLASSNEMDVVDQQDKTFTLVFHKKLSLNEYKDKINEFKGLNEISSVEKIYLTTEDTDDTNDQ